MARKAVPSSEFGTLYPRWLGAAISGTGVCMPEDMWTNKRLLEERLIPANKELDITPLGMTDRTGIQSRFFAGKETIVDMGAEAGKDAIERAGLKPRDIALIVAVSSTYTENVPAAAGQIQNALGLRGPAAFDLRAACSGFNYALFVASQMTNASGRPSLVVAAEKYSPFLDPADYKTASLFGDGAAAVVIEKTRGNHLGYFCLGNDSTREKETWLRSSMLADRYLSMEGNHIHSFVLSFLPGFVEFIRGIASEINENTELYVPHQANRRMLVATAKKAEIPPDKIIVDGMKRVGNIGAASIPYTLHYRLNPSPSDENPPLKRNGKLALIAFGGNMNWGSVFMRVYE